VNEGVAEWPPSPYRLLRALYDTWKRKCPHLSETAVGSVLGALASEPPRFALPAAVASHTRSYLSSNSEDPTDKSLIFDAFLAFNGGAACFMIWPDLSLTNEQRETLSELLEVLNYLGRSESWVEASLYEEEVDARYWCRPLDGGEGSGEVVPVACVMSPGEYVGKRPWLDALTASTSEVLKGRQSGPPLLRTVRYVRPEEAMVTDPVPRAVRRPPSAQAVLLALDSTVLPLVTATIEIAEQIRVRLMGAHKKRMNGDPTQVSSLFSGKENGRKALGHGHVFILPLPNGRGRIDRVLLLSRQRPFTRDELGAVGGVRRLWQSDERPDVRCVIAWEGGLSASEIRKPTSTVASVTPFVTIRHLRRGREPRQFLADEIRRECRNHGMPPPVVVEPISRPMGDLFECVEFRRNRKDDPPRPGYAFQLVFDQPVLAPFSLGYGCHFGLGQFWPA
jgi:CRISPR-associated protein Csb2